MSNRTLLRSIPLAVLFLTATSLSAGLAHAQDRSRARGPGVGVEVPLTAEFDNTSPTGALDFTYDAGIFHIDVLGAFLDIQDDSSVLSVGGRFYYTLNAGSAADFSLGGGLLISHLHQDAVAGNPGGNFTDVHLEVGPKVRVFLAPSVALTTTFGLGVFLGDGTADEIGLIGRLSGSFGLTYFFR